MRRVWMLVLVFCTLLIAVEARAETPAQAPAQAPAKEPSAKSDAGFALPKVSTKPWTGDLDGMVKGAVKQDASK